MECQILIGSIFIAASIVAVALTTLCLILKSLSQLFSAKRSDSNPEGIELAEATRNKTQEALSAEASSIDTLTPEAEKPEAERETASLETKESSIQNICVNYEWSRM